MTDAPATAAHPRGIYTLYFTEMWLKWEVMPTQARAPRNAPAFMRDRLIVAAFALGWIGLLAFAGWLAAGA